EAGPRARRAAAGAACRAARRAGPVRVPAHGAVQRPLRGRDGAATPRLLPVAAVRRGSRGPADRALDLPPRAVAGARQGHDAGGLQLAGAERHGVPGGVDVRRAVRRHRRAVHVRPGRRGRRRRRAGVRPAVVRPAAQPAAARRYQVRVWLSASACGVTLAGPKVASKREASTVNGCTYWYQMSGISRTGATNSPARRSAVLGMRRTRLRVPAVVAARVTNSRGVSGGAAGRIHTPPSARSSPPSVTSPRAMSARKCRVRGWSGSPGHGTALPAKTGSNSCRPATLSTPPGP